ncbi:MAG TPA: HdeD family acid-resistance protein [Thermoguttaceae bacterium]|nr:HdeD family acid-resistance protein [Thermoguttaceae bacterium]
MLMGIAMIVIGVMAIATPAVAGTAVVYVIGALLLIAGVIEFIQGLRTEGWTSKIFPSILGLVTAICGVAVLAHPLLGLTYLTLVLAAYFVVGGIWKIVTTFSYRGVTGWPLMLISGIVSLVLGILIWRQWPVSGLWAVGILVGVDLLMTGVAMIGLGIDVRRFKRMTSRGAHPAA